VPALRHLLILTSSTPDFLHSRAARSVCALLAEEFGRQIPKVTVGLCCAEGPVAESAAVRLKGVGVEVVDLPGKRLGPPADASAMATASGLVQSLALNTTQYDFPRPDDPRALAVAIDAIGADAALLFWDTLAEFALPYIKTRAFGYLARPPYESGVSRAKAMPPSLRRTMTLAQFAAQERRHLQRMRSLCAAANICALDTAYYAGHGVACDYVSNTWDDPVGPDWLTRRRELESDKTGIQILGNIGAVGATGNTFGMRYLGHEVLPLLTQTAANSDWTVAICGGGKLAPDLAEALDHPRVRVKGFVDDIDAELLSSGIFLLLNNAGPYTGGYTRVVYASATGACLVAHANLKKSMPELVSGANCLLGETPAEIAGLIKQAMADEGLRRKIGAAARLTYATEYAPRAVAAKLATMLQQKLHSYGHCA
jgi:hypothetical protein